MRNATVPVRFWSKVNRDGPIPEHRLDLGPCWLWTAAVSGPGYGVFNLDGRLVLAHRLAYEWEVGPIPEGLDLDHLCRVRSCIRPSHGEPVTREINAQRGNKGRLKTHCAHGHPWTPENKRPNGKTTAGNIAYCCAICTRERQRSARG